MSTFWQGFVERAGERAHERDLLELENRAKSKQDLYNFYVEIMNNPRLKVDRYQDVLNAAQSVLAVPAGKKVPKELYPESLLTRGGLFLTREEQAQQEEDWKMRGLGRELDIRQPYAERNAMLSMVGKSAKSAQDIPAEQLPTVFNQFGVPPSEYTGMDFPEGSGWDVMGQYGYPEPGAKSPPINWDIIPGGRDRTTAGQWFAKDDDGDGIPDQWVQARTDPYTGRTIPPEGEGWVPMPPMGAWPNFTTSTSTTPTYNPDVTETESTSGKNIRIQPRIEGTPTYGTQTAPGAPGVTAPTEGAPVEGAPMVPPVPPLITRPPAPGSISTGTEARVANRPPAKPPAQPQGSPLDSYDDVRARFGYSSIEDISGVPEEEIDKALKLLVEGKEGGKSISELLSKAELGMEHATVMERLVTAPMSRPSYIFAPLLEGIRVDPVNRPYTGDIIGDMEALLDNPQLVGQAPFNEKNNARILQTAFNSIGLPMPNKNVAETEKNAAIYAGVTLAALQQLRQLVLTNPTLIGMLKGRLERVGIAIGTNVPLSRIDAGLASELNTRAKYFLVMEAKVLMGSRPALAWAQELAKYTADPRMTLQQFMGALEGAEAHARNNIKNYYHQLFGAKVDSMMPDKNAPYMPGAPHVGDLRYNMSQDRYEIAVLDEDTGETWWARPMTETATAGEPYDINTGPVQTIERIWPPPPSRVRVPLQPITPPPR